MLRRSRNASRKWRRGKGICRLLFLAGWSDVYCLSSHPNFHKASKLNESFAHLLDKTLASSLTIALSLDETCKLETCLRGMVESQSSSLWALLAVFEFLRDANCVPGDPAFGHIVGSMTTAINARARASFAAMEFLRQKHRETFVSHLPVSAHQSIKHSLLTTPLAKELFTEEVIVSSLTKVMGDSQLSLLHNLSSKGGKQSASPASSSG